MIQDFKTYIGESRLGRLLSNSFDSELRKEERWGNHDFVDIKGVRHKYGKKATDDTFQDLVWELIEIRGFDADMNDLDVSDVTIMDHTFSHLSSNPAKGSKLKSLQEFCGDISGWNTGKVQSFCCMFQGNKKFNGDISKWDVSSCRSFRDMFEESVFNGDISKWDVSSGENFGWMFCKNHEFNCDISGWNMESATYLGYMFSECESFDHDLSGWVMPNLKPDERNKEYLYSKKKTEFKQYVVYSPCSGFVSRSCPLYSKYDKYPWYEKITKEMAEILKIKAERSDYFMEKSKQERIRRLNRKKKNSVTESRLGRILDHSFSNKVREEDVTNFEKQIRTMEYVDMGLPSGTLWAKKDLTDKEGTDFLAYDEYREDYLNDVLILPTKKQFTELINNTEISKVADGVYKLTSKINGNELVFEDKYDNHFFDGNIRHVKEVIDENGEKQTYEPLNQWPCYTPAGNIWKFWAASKNLYKDEVGDFGKKAMLIRVVKKK